MGVHYRDRHLNRYVGELFEDEFKDYMESVNQNIEIELTQRNTSSGSYTYKGYIGGDANVKLKSLKHVISHVELKTKNTDSFGHYGVELYRLHDYLKVGMLMSREQDFDVPVFYVIKDKDTKEWIFQRFTTLWDYMKIHGVEIYDGYDEESLGHYTLNDGLLEEISRVKKEEKRVFLRAEEIAHHVHRIKPKRTIGKIRVMDKGHYSNYDELDDMSIIYFSRDLFKILKR